MEILDRAPDRGRRASAVQPDPQRAPVVGPTEALRDVFSPMLRTFGASVLAMSPGEIRSVVPLPRTRPLRAKYPSGGGRGWSIMGQSTDSPELARLCRLVATNLHPLKPHPRLLGRAVHIEAFEWAATDTVDDCSLARYSVVPINAYGETHACLQVVTSRVLLTLSESMRGMALSIQARNPDLITRHTTRGREGYPAAPLVTLQEGIQSIGSATAQLTAERVSGCRDALGQLGEVVRAGLPSRFAREVPAGLVQPYAFAGLRLRGIAERGPDGNLRLEPELMRGIRAERKYPPRHSPDSMEHGCAAAWHEHDHGDDSLQHVSDAYEWVYRALADGS